MKPIIKAAFALFLLAHIPLSSRPTGVNAAVVLHAAAFALLIGLTVAGWTVSTRSIRVHRHSLWITLFLLYFLTVNVFLSTRTDAPLLEVLEYPYRVAALFIALLVPGWLDKEDVRFLLRLGVAVVLVQLLRDFVYGYRMYGEALLASRLWSAEFGSLLFLAATGFVIGWIVVEGDKIRTRPLLMVLVVLAVGLVGLKLLVSYSRTVWFAVVPANILLVYWFLRSPQHRRLRIVSVVVLAITIACVGGLLVVNAGAREFAAYRMSLLDYSIGIKLDEFQAIATEGLQTPVLGRGFSEEVEFWKGAYYRRQAHVHNVFLQFFFSGGLIGLALFVWGYGKILIDSCRLRNSAKSDRELGVAFAVASVMTSFLIMGQVQSLFRREETYMIMAFCVVLLVTATEQASQEVKVDSASPAGPA